MIDELPALDELERRLLDGCYPARGRPARPWRWASAGVLAAACGGLVLLLLVGSGSGELSAAMALDRTAAAVARGASQAPLRTGQYWYTRTLLYLREPLPIVPRVMPVGQPAGPVPLAWFNVRQNTETWIGLDGTLRQRQTPLSIRFASPADRARWRAAHQRFPGGFAGDSDSITVGDGRFPPQLAGGPNDVGDGLFTYAQLMSLPTSVAQLRARIEQAEGAFQARTQRGFARSTTRGPGTATIRIYSPLSPTQTRASSDLQAIAALLASPIPTAVRASLFRVAATLPGVIYQGVARDPLGRAGVAVAVGSGRTLTRMVFDPRTGQLLAETEGPQLVSVIVAQGVVGSINALPPHLVPVPRAPRTAPQLPTISPRTGGARTAFKVTIATHSASTRVLPPIVADLFGPTGPGCRFWASRPPFVRLPSGTVARRAGSTTYRYRLAPSAIGRHAWCAGRYELQLTPGLLPGTSDQVQTAVYFTVT